MRLISEHERKQNKIRNKKISGMVEKMNLFLLGFIFLIVIVILATFL